MASRRASDRGREVSDRRPGRATSTAVGSRDGADAVATDRLTGYIHVLEPRGIKQERAVPMTHQESEDPLATERLADSSREVLIHGYRLVVVEGADAGLRAEAIEGRCTVGTHTSCDLQLSDMTVSRFHCELSSDERYVQIRDLDSTNGTSVDGVRIARAFVKHGSLLRLGRTKLQVHFVGKTNRLLLSEKHSFGHLVGQSIAMRSMFARLQRVAQSDVTILLEGETGTGKTAAAHSIHLESARRGPFVDVDCGALPSNLLESELFGHEKGAFTGAHARRIGAFEEASGGSLFLDEIGEIPVALQAKLLTALEGRRIRRVGGNRSQPVDVRIIAATNRDLRSEVNQGSFREDLYYRLAVVKIEVPPLRRRLDDLPMLVATLLDGLHVTPEQRAALATPDLLASLGRSAWPGNIRQLRNFLQQYLLFEDMEFVEMDFGDDSDGGGQGDGDGERILIDTGRSMADNRRRVLAQFERLYIQAQLEENGGKVARVAARAGVNRTHVYRLMQRHGIKR